MLRIEPEMHWFFDPDAGCGSGASDAGVPSCPTMPARPTTSGSKHGEMATGR